MAEIVVTGYASLDYPVQLSGQAERNRTTRIRFRDPGAWPRLGGAPAYVGAALARAGHSAVPVTWIGEDEAGALFRQKIAEAGMAVDGISVVNGSRSPIALMVHQADGSTICLYDPGSPGGERLDEVQRAYVDGATHVCFTVGPGHLVAELLGLLKPEARLYWIVKNDPASLTPDLATRLARRAQVIFCSQSERALVGRTHEAVIVETMGPRGCRVTAGGETRFMPGSAVDVSDPTGAGDTFAGAFIARFVIDGDAHAATSAAAEATKSMLEARRAREGGLR